MSEVVIALDEGLEFRVLPVEALEADPDNPNVEDLPVFNALVEGMREWGILEAVLVRPVGPGRWRLVAGEHRWKAARLAGKRLIPALCRTDWTEQDAKIHLVRMNALRGRFDPERFTRLWTELRRQYDEEELRRRLGFGGREAELRRLVRTAARGLPEGLRQELERRAERIRRVEDLAAVVQTLFARYGSTLDSHFVLFSFGGQTHLMVRADEASFAPIRALAERCGARGARLDRVLAARAACPCPACEAATEEEEER